MGAPAGIGHERSRSRKKSSTCDMGGSHGVGEVSRLKVADYAPFSRAVGRGSLHLRERTSTAETGVNVVDAGRRFAGRRGVARHEIAQDGHRAMPPGCCWSSWGSASE